MTQRTAEPQPQPAPRERMTLEVARTRAVLTTEDVADLLEVSPKTVTRHRVPGRISELSRAARYRAAVEQLVAHGAPEPRGDLHAWLREVVPVLTRPLRHHGNHRYAFPLSRAARRSLPASLPYPKLGIRPANGNARSEVA